MSKKVPIRVGIIIPLLLLVAVGSANVDGNIGPVDASEAVEDTTAANITAWSSGWVTVTRGSFRTLTHGLGGDISNYAVDLWFWDTDEGGLGIHQYAYGGLEQAGNWYGGYWSNLTNNTISVWRELDDDTSDLMLVRIRVIDPPNYDSDWVEIAEGQVMTLTHGLGGNPEDYVVSLWFDDQDTLLGVHNYCFGGAEEAGSYYGVHWRNLSDSTIRIVRAPDELYADRVRVRIVKSPPTPDYDSGWLPIDAGETLTLTHNLGGQLILYRGNLQYRDTSGLTDSLGLNTRFFGGAAVGSALYGGHWQRLTTSTVELYRQTGGVRSTEIRVRLWGPESTVCLPLIVKSTAGE